MKKAQKKADQYSSATLALTGRQCRTARAWLNWTRDDLARESAASVRAIANLEDGKVATLPGTLALLRRALERDGVTFVGDGLELQPIKTGESVARKP